MLFCEWAVGGGRPSSLHCAASPAGVPGGRDFSPVHLEQPVSRQEGFGRPDSLDSVRTGDALPLACQCERSWPCRRVCVSLSCWLVSPQFQDPDFGGLSGGRVVRIAVHPDYQGVTCPPSSRQLR